MTDHYTFLSWVRDGAAVHIDQGENLAADLPRRATICVQLDLESVPSRPAGLEQIDMALAAYGPGDVLSLDWDEIVRVDPLPGSVGFEPHCAPVVEFRRPDLPWLFSPVAGVAATRHKLRPWLCLVVVPQDAAALLPGMQGRLPRLRCSARELPEPDESWAWAHAQVVNLSPNESVTTVLRQEPERALSRLIGPRRLEPERSYYACVVPTFKAGAEAALGEDVSTGTLAPAWPGSADPDADRDVDLPAYYHWGFTTGVGGDFEALVRRLTPQPVRDGGAVRPLDVGNPGAGVVTREPGDSPELLPIAGVFVAEGHRDEPWSTPAGQRFETELRERFEARADATTAVVGPPLYGRWYAGVTRPPAAGQQPHWVRDLNLDPRLRTYAGLGVQTVQRHQDALMASAWEQLDEIEAVNQALREAQLAREVSNATQRRRLNRLRPATLVQVTRGAHQDLAYEGGSLHDVIAHSDAPEAVATSTLRRMVRPRGPLVRRSAHFTLNNRLDPHAFVQQAASGGAEIDTQARPAGGQVTLDDLSAIASTPLSGGTSTFKDTLLRSQEFLYKDPVPLWRYLSWVQGTGGQNLRVTSNDAYENAFTAAITLVERQKWLFRELLEMVQTFPVGPPIFLDPSNFASVISEELAPDVTIAAKTQARVESEVPPPDGAVEPILAAPRFPTPMVELLRELAPELMLAGAGGMPPESVSLVRVNDGLVYAYLIGLNHGMAAELLWRGYPTDQRGTYFRRFWDRSGHDGAAPPGQAFDEDGPVDIPPLHQLPPDLRLLGDDAVATGERLTLLIRGELMRRHPRLWVYATPAVVDGERRRPATGQTKEALYSGRLATDAAYFAFDLTPDEARGDESHPGWFIVFHEPPTEVRFGLDEPAESGEPGTVPASLDDLAWHHVLPEGGRYASVRTILDTTTFAERVDPDDADAAPVTWRANGAHMARCLMQWPVSVAFHAEALLPPTTPDANGTVQ